MLFVRPLKEARQVDGATGASPVCCCKLQSKFAAQAPMGPAVAQAAWAQPTVVVGQVVGVAQPVGGEKGSDNA